MFVLRTSAISLVANAWWKYHPSYMEWQKPSVCRCLSFYLYMCFYGYVYIFLCIGMLNNWSYFIWSYLVHSFLLSFSSLRITSSTFLLFLSAPRIVFSKYLINDEWLNKWYSYVYWKITLLLYLAFGIWL